MKTLAAVFASTIYFKMVQTAEKVFGAFIMKTALGFYLYWFCILPSKALTRA